MTGNGAGAAWRLTRSKILLVAGLLGVSHETVVASQPRPYLLLLFGAMMGLAGFAKVDDLLASRGVTITLNKPDGDAAEPQPNGGRS